MSEESSKIYTITVWVAHTIDNVIIRNQPSSYQVAELKLNKDQFYGLIYGFLALFKDQNFPDLHMKIFLEGRELDYNYLARDYNNGYYIGNYRFSTPLLTNKKYRMYLGNYGVETNNLEFIRCALTPSYWFEIQPDMIIEDLHDVETGVRFGIEFI